MSTFTSAALLAGGKSRRMGFDKQLLHIEKNRIFKHIIPTLTKQFEEVIVVTDKPEIYGEMDVRVIKDIYPGHGPLSGIHAAVSESKSEYTYILACDMPKIDLNYINYMIQIHKKTPFEACVTKTAKGLEPFHGFYGKSGLTAMEEDLLADKNAISSFLRKINTLYIPEETARKYSPDLSIFRNLNTPKDYAAFLESAGA